ncbi:MAG: ACP S-malonyltransferase [Anaerolineae bacterium]|jgi:[acyl-carrier-protein] S-malonyltransferase|nr:ACP S-malonyltransferase [Ardenticatenia bacterium]HQZ70926.1 ACP S-malonyltransferase [Anaerolineae bacterium]
MAVAWLFPGQGSQYVGMAGAWVQQSACARDALAEASEHLSFDLAGLMAEGPLDVLSDTYNQQPALLAASVAILRAAFDELPPPDFVAGHSLGEYSALVAAGALGYPEALSLVRERGRLMQLAGSAAPGGMAAILGLEDAQVETICGTIAGVQVANYNASGQVVISGERAAVETAVLALKDAGAKRTVILPITIAAHSFLMAPAAAALALAIDRAGIVDANTPLIANLSAQPIRSATELRHELRGQLTGSVRWAESVRRLASEGVDHFIEIGSGTVLSGLVKRILRDQEGPPATVVSLDQPLAA